ncbi:MAG TPA: polysaccharide deacetylase family protein [Pseudonocardia sp.]|nr:polysaccharide deacetylase family protein [Pseudonocardia sp.]
MRPTGCFPAALGAGERGLQAQFRVLRRFTNVLPLEQALRDLLDGRPLPPRAVAITFDDGYRDNLELAGPMLRRLGLPATCFLVPGLLDGDVSPWWEELAWIFDNATAPAVEWAGAEHPITEPSARRAVFKRIAEDVKRVDRIERDATVARLREGVAPRGRYDLRSHFMDWDEARRLQEYMSIGSHTTYHAILANETPQAQREDLAGSRRRLEAGLGAPVRVLAYPNGKSIDYDDHTRAAAAAAGYDFSITTRNGVSTPGTPRHDVRRWVMNPHRGPRDFAKVVRDLARDPGR